MSKNVNILFVFADQWRAQAFGYAGDPNVKTPNIERSSERPAKDRLVGTPAGVRRGGG